MSLTPPITIAADVPVLIAEAISRLDAIERQLTALNRRLDALDAPRAAPRRRGRGDHLAEVERR